MQTQIYPQMVNGIKSREIRKKLEEVFGFSASGPTSIKDQEVESYGYTQEDTNKITHEKMNEYIGSQETFLRAWEVTLAKCHAELNPPIGEIRKTNGEGTNVELDAVLPVNFTKEEVKELEKIVDDKIVDVFIETKTEVVVIPEEKKEKPVIMFTPEEPKPRFCQTCDSLGVRHKNYCPKYVEIRHGKQ